MKNNEFKTITIQQCQLDKDTHAEKITPTHAEHFILSPDGSIISLNSYGYELLESNQTQLAGHKFGSFIADNHQLAFNSFLQELALNHHSALTCELTLHTNNFPQKHVSISGSTTNINEITLIATDISKRVIAEAALRKVKSY